MTLSQEPHFPFSSQFMPRMLCTTGTKKGSRHIPGHFSKHHHHTKLFETDIEVFTDKTTPYKTTPISLKGAGIQNS